MTGRNRSPHDPRAQPAVFHHFNVSARFPNAAILHGDGLVDGELLINGSHLAVLLSQVGLRGVAGVVKGCSPTGEPLARPFCGKASIVRSRSRKRSSAGSRASTSTNRRNGTTRIGSFAGERTQPSSGTSSRGDARTGGGGGRRSLCRRWQVRFATTLL